MSGTGSGTPATPSLTFTTGNAALDGVILKLIGMAAVGIVAWAAQHLKISDPEYIAALTAGVISVLAGVAAVVWGVILTGINRARNMQSALLMAHDQQAIDTQGKIIPMGNPDSTPPLPVTVTSSAQIEKNYPPTAKAA